MDAGGEGGKRKTQSEGRGIEWGTECRFLVTMMIVVMVMLW